MQAFTAKPTVDHVDELEILLTAQRLSFFASPATSGSAGSLREAIADFRVALNPQSHLTASPALSHAEVPILNQVPVCPKGTETPAKARELDLESPIHCVCLDGANLVSELAQHIEAVHAKSECEIHRLVDIIMGLKAELSDFRASVEASRLDPERQDHHISPNPTMAPHFFLPSSRSTTPGPDAVCRRAASPPVNGVQGHSPSVRNSAPRVSAAIMSPLSTRIPSPNPPRGWIENGMQDKFTPKPAALGKGCPLPSRAHSPAAPLSCVSVTPIPPIPRECLPDFAVPIIPPMPPEAASPPEIVIPEVLSEKNEQARECTCQTTKKKVKSKKRGMKWEWVTSKKRCTNCIKKESAEREEEREDVKRSNHTTPIPPLPELACSSPHTSQVASIPESGVSTSCLDTKSALLGRPSAPPHALGLALSRQFPESPTISIEAPIMHSLITPSQQLETPPPPPPSLPHLINERMAPPKVFKVATALNSFLTIQSEELAFERGDTILVLNAPVNPTGWLLGQDSSGRRGLFPERYVKLAA